MLTTGQCQELLFEYPALGKQVGESCLHVFSEAQFVEIAAGTIMFQQDHPCKNFMWLLEGSVRVFRNSEEGREVTVYRVAPGDFCLLSLNSLLSGGSYPASAKSETDSKGLMISAQQFYSLMDESKGFRNYVLRALTERLTDVISLASDVTFRRLELRLACLLGQQFERSRGTPLKITHAELACELGTTREVVSRILKDFERQQCISLNRGLIHLVSQEGLNWVTNKTKNAG